MAKKRVRLGNDPRPVLAAAAEALLGGAVIVFPTETVYGIGALSGHAGALAELRRLKGRAADKPFQLLAADMEMARKTGAILTGRAARLARACWPGPLTLVVPDGAGGTLGVRVPDSPLIPALCRELGRPIVSSSANPAGAPPPLDADAADVFGDDVDLLVDGGPVAGGVPSTVVRCGVDDFEILRRGAVADDVVRAAWEGNPSEPSRT